LPSHGLDLPRGGALLARLAEQEADLLEGLCEGVFARHRGGWCVGGRMGVGAKSEERQRRDASLYGVAAFGPKSVSRANWGSDRKKVASDWPEGSTSVSSRALYLQRLQ
jgi:hypothetical protein